TYYTGFKVNSGEYKVMGLAPYGEPKYVDAILTELVHLREDGSFTLNQSYFNYLTGLTMTNGAFDRLFGGPPRVPESKLTQRELDLARAVQGKDGMRGAYLGPAYTPDEIERYLRSQGAAYERLERPALLERVASLLADEKIVGWFDGRMEFGPRALGARSILGDPRSPRMQAQMNIKIKFREGFRPFAPSVLRERVSDYFELECDSPYMLLVAPVQRRRQIPMTQAQRTLWGIDQLNVVRSDIPAVTHIDYSARIQTADRE